MCILRAGRIEMCKQVCVKVLDVKKVANSQRTLITSIHYTHTVSERATHHLSSISFASPAPGLFICLCRMFFHGTDRSAGPLCNVFRARGFESLAHVGRTPLSRADGSPPVGSWKQKRRLRGPSVLGSPILRRLYSQLECGAPWVRGALFSCLCALWPALPLSQALGWGSL